MPGRYWIRPDIVWFAPGITGIYLVSWTLPGLLLCPLLDMFSMISSIICGVGCEMSTHERSKSEGQVIIQPEEIRRLEEGCESGIALAKMAYEGSSDRTGNR